jgi:flagellar hook assembly protein FlgD
LWALLREPGRLEPGPTHAPEFSLDAGVPNPFHASTFIRFALPHRARVNLRVFDTLGRTMKVLVEEELGPGAYAITWEGRDDDGHRVPSGVYYCRFRSVNYSRVHKLTLLK